MADQDLPPGWTAIADEEGDYYYWNEETDETVWEKPVVKKAPPPPPPKKPAKPAKPARVASPVNSSQFSSVRTENQGQSALDTRREMQRANESAAEQSRKDELRAAQLRSERNNLAPVTAPGPAYEFKKVEQVSAISEIRLDTGVMKWGSGGRSRSPSRLGVVSAMGSGYSLMSVAKGAAGNVSERAYPSGCYNGDDFKRTSALNVLFQGGYECGGKKLLLEGPLSKRNRDGLQIYQFFLFDKDLVYAEVTNKDRYQVHNVFPLATCGVEMDAEANGFVMLSPSKSFVVVADTPEVRSKWVATLSSAVRAANGRVDVKGQFATVWRPNSSAKDCEVCHDAFNLLKRRHHCRNCGKVVCGACSAEKLRLEHISKDEFLRVCIKCYQEVKMTKSYGVQTSSHSPSSSTPPASFPTSAPVPPRATTVQQFVPQSAPPAAVPSAKFGLKPVGQSSGPPSAPPMNTYRAPPTPPRAMPPMAEDGPPPPVPPRLSVGDATPQPPPPPPPPSTGGPPPPPPPSLFSLEQLQATPLPGGVDPASKEMYLLDEKFQALFGCDKATFQKMPAWQRTNKKKANGLF